MSSAAAKDSVGSDAMTSVRSTLCGTSLATMSFSSSCCAKGAQQLRKVRSVVQVLHRTHQVPGDLVPVGCEHCLRLCHDLRVRQRVPCRPLGCGGVAGGKRHRLAVHELHRQPWPVLKLDPA